jgi:uncharacterized protein YggE
MSEPRIRPVLRTVLLTAAVLLLTSPAGAQMPQPDGSHPPHEPVPSIVVNGDGEVRVAPDEAMVRLGVVAQEESARQAQNEASRIADAILSAVAELGVENDAIQTSQLYLTPVYEQGGPRQQVPTEPRIIAYRASNTVSIRLDDLSKIGPVIDAGIDNGSNQVEGVSFQVRDDRAARRDALTAAVTEARGKAEAMAAALGVSLGPILDAREGGYSIERPEFAQARMMAMDAGGGGTPVAPGQVTISASVTLRYRIGE